MVPNPDNIHITACELKAEQGHASVRQESRASAQGKLSVISGAAGPAAAPGQNFCQSYGKQKGKQRKNSHRQKHGQLQILSE
ncbi:hypothetical protein, partial [Akkermansia sp.]|uniref:hypothetical protein n=1 Tax=Akkermansia sp. TaxID=1872421 RepID=UPI003AB760A3